MNDPQIIPVFVSGTILLVLFAFFIIAYLLVQKQKQNAYGVERRAMIYEHQKKILTARIDEQEHTMSQMSKEIHDNIGQLLHFTKMNVFAINKYAVDQDQILLIEKTQKLLDLLIKDVNNISHSLNSDYIKGHGLIKIIEEEMEYIKLSAEIDCQLAVAGSHIDFDSRNELLIYRIVQEATQNVMKHSKATQLCIKLDYQPEIFTLKISDNGLGFSKSKIFELNGIGFLNMLERAKLLNGNLHIDGGQSNSGCVITFHADTAGLQRRKAEDNFFADV